MTSQYEYHEAANIFPMMEGDSFDELVADIKTNGLREDIELLDGKILDGRNRHSACTMAGVKPRFKTVAVDDPVAYVLSKNLHRRHLDKSQRGLVAGSAQKLWDKYKAEAKERQRKHGGTAPGKAKDTQVNSSLSVSGQSRDQIGVQFGISGPTVDRGRKVAELGIPELAQAVHQGKMSITAAAKLASEPAEVQREAVKTGRPRNPIAKPKVDETPPGSDGKILGVGVMRANEAINCLIRIPKDDPLRKRGFQIVTDWIKSNK